MTDSISQPPASPAPLAAPPAPSSEADQYLSMLSVAYKVVAVLTGLFAFLPIVHIVIGAGIFTGTLGEGSPDDVVAGQIVGGLFVAIGLAVIAAFLATAVLFWIAGTKLRRTEGFVLCLVAAAIACSAFPIGTVLGVLTFVVLFRDDVRPRFTSSLGAA